MAGNSPTDQYRSSASFRRWPASRSLTTPSTSAGEKGLPRNRVAPALSARRLWSSSLFAAVNVILIDAPEMTMSENGFDLEAWLHRIGHAGAREPSLATLRAVIAAHTATIPFENIDVLIGRPPKLDLAALQAKLIG